MDRSKHARLTAGVAMSALLMACGAPAEDGTSPLDVSDVDPSMIGLPSAGEATDATREANAALAARLPIDEPSDRADVERGFLAALDDDAILDADGNVVWAIRQFDFLAGNAPDTVNPSLWRQSQLAAKHGLFEVVEGIYQVRGYDLSVMTVIAGDTGWIVIDPLTTSETAAAALGLVNETLGERPVSAVLYTHSHADHFGGARGIIDEAEIAERGIPVLAPVGFAEHAVSENLLAGNHMSRRAAVMFGNTLPRSQTGHVGAGLGPGLPQGTIGLIPPTEEIFGDGSQRRIDGVLFEFVDAAGTEAPAEFMFYLPEFRALCTSEVSSGTLHNVLTPRGAQVRDALTWSRVIDRMLVEYGDRSDVVFASHHWPTWGTENVATYLTRQRDIYRYIHDQTLRQANAGASQVEAAEAVVEPAFQAGEDAFHTRGYYGTLNHNSKAVYQFYFGWWSGVPAHYFKRPHAETASRYVAAMGGADAVLEVGQSAFAEGDYRWAAEVFNHLVFADPAFQPGREWLAATYEQLGFQSESGVWRSYFLTGAAELRRGVPDLGNPQLGSNDFLRAVPSLELFDSMATRYVPGRLDRDPFAIEFRFGDTDETVSLVVEKSVLVPRDGSAEGPAAIVSMDRADFDRLILQQTRAIALIATGRMGIEGDRSALQALFASLDTPPFWFNIMEP
ncbi:MAG: alkyl sulfatase dimerization domain-containing protein [Pseudomonadota bacterium]